MTRLIFCTKLQQEAEGVDYPPYPNELGKKVYDNISKEAWQSWIARQTMFINEYRLDLTEPKARLFLMEEMEKFLFGDDSQAPAGYQAPDKS